MSAAASRCTSLGNPFGAANAYPDPSGEFDAATVPTYVYCTAFIANDAMSAVDNATIARRAVVVGC